MTDSIAGALRHIGDAAAGRLPEHTHLGAYTAVAGCPECARYGAINPDTLTPWPSLDDHGEEVLRDAADRFSDRYDGDNHAEALEAAVKEAYLRGRMQGRREKERELDAAAEGAITNALSHLRSAEDAAEKGDERTAASHAGLANSHADAARTLRRHAGPRP